MENPIYSAPNEFSMTTRPRNRDRCRSARGPASWPFLQAESSPYRLLRLGQCPDLIPDICRLLEILVGNSFLQLVSEPSLFFDRLHEFAGFHAAFAAMFWRSMNLSQKLGHFVAKSVIASAASQPPCL